MKLKKKVDDLLKKETNSEALLKEGMSMLDEAMKIKDDGRAKTKAETANAITQNARKTLEDVQTAISNRDSKRKKKRKTQICQGVSPTCSCLCSRHKSCNFIMLH